MKNFCFAVSFALLGAFVWAEEARSPADESEKPVYELSKMVVSPARGAPQEILNVPQSVAVMDEEALATSLGATANDLLQELPGVAAAPTGGGDSSNRNSDYWNSGYTLRGLGGQRVLLISDGIRQSGQGVGYGGGNLSLYDTASLERIEVLKGPGSVLYGTDAFGGVVQLFTRQPAEREVFGTNARSRTSFDASRNIFTQSGWVDVGEKNWGIVVGGSYSEAATPTLPEGATTSYQGNYRKQCGNVSFAYRPSDDEQWRLLANIVSAYDIRIFDASDYSGGSTGAFYYKIPYYQRAMVAAEYEKERPVSWVESWKVGVYAQELKRHFEHATPLFVYTPFPHFSATDTVHTSDRVRTVEAQGQLVLDLAPHELTLGADVGRDSTYLPETSSLSGPTLKADASQVRAGLYAQDRWQAAEKHLFTLGTRADVFEITDRLAASAGKTTRGLSGALGYTYLLSAQTSLYASASSGFRSPDLDERYGHTTMQFFNEQVTVEGNPSLDTERAYSFELGAKRDAEEGVWELAGYYNNIHDFVGLRTVSSTVISGSRTSVVKLRDNLGDVDIYGLEASWKSPSSSPWRNYANLSRAWTDSTEAVSLTRWKLGYGIGFRFGAIGKYLRSVMPQWQGRFVTGSRDTVNDVYFPAYHEADVQVRFEFASTGRLRHELTLGVKNIFDARYSEAFFDEPQPGRGLYALWQVDF